ncbi:MAG: FadR family transcriptional regulator [Rhodococcus sp. (in: high G+C Gram-positive bacteria)]|uniref:FadR/GntR family transcriptional regulator n=1 Tax=Rhodococcus sp. TaxID=1831 RepID=UPI0012103621|nr:GntR family transcriptional regulator [Rhodococcus sp. (in: high G+C Gram-positive bacteria)]RZL23104.1 MAG: FadR family transcriptional regulator [Rhodococcus sp. (in: high G+C Gram-positive bacteria)]
MSARRNDDDRGSTADATDVATYGLPIVYAPRGFSAADTQNPHTRAPKAAEVTASRIVDDILWGSVRVGEKLPTEPEMLERYEVSRESLREALRLLEIQGIVDIKRGPGGGPFVAPLNSGYLARTTSLYFHLSGATYSELLDTWAALEPTLAERAARLPSSKTKREMFTPFLQYDTESHVEVELFDDFNNFHALIAALSGNRVLTLVTQAVTHIVAEQVLQSVDPIAEREMLSHSHADLAQAILDGRPSKARKLMTEHILEVTETYLKRDPNGGARRIDWRL